MLVRSVTVAMRVSPQVEELPFSLPIPNCPICHEKANLMILSIPSGGRRVWEWLVGHGWIRPAVVALGCGHQFDSPTTVFLMAHVMMQAGVGHRAVQKLAARMSTATGLRLEEILDEEAEQPE
jgi:hypothetical protein